MTLTKIQQKALSVFNEASERFSASATAQGAFLALENKKTPGLLQTFGLFSHSQDLLLVIKKAAEARHKRALEEARKKGIPEDKLPRIPREVTLEDAKRVVDGDFLAASDMSILEPYELTLVLGLYPIYKRDEFQYRAHVDSRYIGRKRKMFEVNSEISSK